MPVDCEHGVCLSLLALSRCRDRLGYPCVLSACKAQPFPPPSGCSMGEQVLRLQRLFLLPPGSSALVSTYCINPGNTPFLNFIYCDNLIIFNVTIMQFCITAKRTDVTSAFTWDKNCYYF